MPRLPPPVVEDAEGWWLCHVAKQDSLLRSLFGGCLLELCLVPPQPKASKSKMICLVFQSLYSKFYGGIFFSLHC